MTVRGVLSRMASKTACGFVRPVSTVHCIVALLFAWGTMAPAQAQRSRNRAARVQAGRAPAYFDPKHLEREPVLSASSALLMDDATGKILWSRNADTRRFPASTTKILTALLMAELVPTESSVRCNDPKIDQVGESSLNIRPGESFPAEDLLKGFLLRSANDAGVVIAQHIDGSVAQFARRMNEKARDLGATHSRFTNPHGLHDPGHYTTARDLALITRAALRNERFAEAVRIPQATIRRSISDDKRVVAKSKRLFYDKVPGADGVKTGFTRPAGHCFVGSATRGGRRLIAIILGAKASACQETIPLIEWGFRRFPSKSVASPGPLESPVAVAGGKSRFVPVEVSETLRVPYDVLGGEPAPVVRREFSKVKAPVRIGDKLGRIVAEIDGKVVAEVPIVATQSVAVSPVVAPTSTRTWLGLGGGVAVGLLIRWRNGRRQRRRPFAKGSGQRWSRVPPHRGDLDRRRQGRG